MKIEIDKKLEQDISIKVPQLKDEFNAIFTNKKLHDILQEDISSFPLWYHYMNYLIITSAELHSLRSEQISESQNIFHYLRRIKSYIKQSLSKKDEDELDVLFVTRDRFIKIRTIEGILKSDYLFYSIIHNLNKNYPRIRIGLLSNINNPPDVLNIDIFTLQRYITLTTLLKSILFATKKRVQWIYYKNKIFKNVNEDEYADTSSVPLTNYFFHFKSLLYYFINDNSYHNAFNKLKPKVIVSNDDLIELKPNINYNNLKFITLQSASISPKNEYYRRLFISEFGSDKIKSDYFLCTGVYFKALKEFSKTAKKVVVTGQPRYDVLYHADKIYDRTKIMRDLGLNSNKKMVLWTTSTHSLSLEKNLKCIKAVYNTISSLKDVQLVIKLHPEEDQNASLYKEDKPFKPVIVEGRADTYALLYACDLMITKSSTTATEAVALNKPVIILNLSGEPDPIDSVKEGVALGVYKEEDLKTAIEKLLKDDSELAKNRKHYIEKYLYKIDGKATERVINLIEEMIKESKRDRNERIV
jgi:glycosyltransferase involved in cell wall biosynthesis